MESRTEEIPAIRLPPPTERYEASRLAAPEVGLDMTQDVEHFTKNENNPEMKRMLKATVSRMVARDLQRVSREALLDYIAEEEGHARKCLRFPFTIMYFVLFVITVLMHEDITNVSQVERNFRNMLEGTSFEGITPEYPVSGHKIMEDIDLVADIWTYLYDAIIPLFIPSLNGTAASDMNRVLRYNQLIGGVQLQQIRRPKKLCVDQYPKLGPKVKDTDVNPLLVGFSCYPWDSYTKDCFGSQSTPGFCPDSHPSSQPGRRLSSAQTVGEAARQLFAPHHASKVQGRSKDALASGSLGTFEGGLYTVVLHEHEGLASALAKLKQYQALEWIDTGTAWFGVKMFVMNPDLSVYTHVLINVWFPPSGELIPAVQLNSFPAEPYQYMSRIAADVFWALLLFHLLVCCVMDLLKACFQEKAKEYFMSFWAWVNWGSLMGGLAIMVMWFVFLSMLSSVQEKTLDVVTQRPKAEDNFQFLTPVQRTSYFENVDVLHSEVAGMAGFLVIYRLGVCWYTILIMMRFFQAFEAQPRLAIVTHTISRSMTDLLHFTMVLTLVFLSYAIAGMFLFGHRMLMFSEVGIAIHQCFLIMLGNFEYDELAKEHPLTAALWFWSYVIMVSLIMLNMALAIVMDIYTEVKIDAENTDDIFTQGKRVIANMFYKWDWVSHKDITVAVNAMDATIEHVTKDSLLQAVPHLHEEQAEELIQKTEKREIAEESKGLSISDAMKMVGWIKIAVQKIAANIEDIIVMEKQEKQILQQLRPAMGEAGLSGDGVGGEYVTLDPASDQKLYSVERRLASMEEFLNENMSQTVVRGKEMRNRLTLIEDLLKGQREATSAAGGLLASTGRGGTRSAVRSGRSTPVSPWEPMDLAFTSPRTEASAAGGRIQVEGDRTITFTA